MHELTEQHEVVLVALDEVQQRKGPQTATGIAKHIEAVLLHFYDLKVSPGSEFSYTVDALRDLCRMGLVEHTGDPAVTPLWSVTPSGHRAIKESE